MAHKGGIAGWDTVKVGRGATFVTTLDGKKYVGEVLEYDVDEDGDFADGAQVAFYRMQRDGSYDSSREIDADTDLWADLAEGTVDKAAAIIERHNARRKRSRR